MCILLARMEKLKSKLAETGEYKSKEYESEADEVSQAHITSFPTIILFINGKKMEYQGPRTAEDILQALKNPNFSGGEVDQLIKNRYKQCGGSKKDKEVEFFRMKYLKYKAKYMKLKGHLE